MNGLLELSVLCPYCSEENLLLIDASVSVQDYVEDCQVCCQPMRITARVENGNIVALEALREND